MREDTEKKIIENLRLPIDQRHKLTIPQQDLMDKVCECLSLLNDDLLMPVPKLRDKLVEVCGCTPRHAYSVIRLAFEAIGNRKPTAKNVVREQILQMAREMHEEAQTLSGVDKIDGLAKAGNMLARAFATSVDEGEVLDAAKYLTDETVEFTTDPSIVNVKWTEANEEKSRKLRRKYGIEDADFEEVVEDTEFKEETGEEAGNDG